MKIAIVSRIFLPHIGGIETLTADIAFGLVTRGVNVMVLTSKYNSHLPTDVVMNGVRVKRYNIVTLPGLRRLFIAPRTLLDWDIDVDIAHFISCYPNWLNWYGVFRCWLNRYPIIYTTIWPIPLTYRLYEGHVKKYLGHFHDNVLLKHLLGKATAVTTLTSGEAKIYDKILGHSKEIHVIPECVRPPDQIRPDIVDTVMNRYKIKDNESVLINVGRVTQYKRIDLALYAFYLASKRLSNTRLLVVGPIDDSSYYNYLLKVVKDLNLSEKIIFTGKVSFEERDALYSISSIVLHTSEYEAFVRPALEGWRYKKPIITFNLSPASDFIEEEEGGIVTRKWGDVHEMAESIVSLIESNYYLELGRKGFEALMNKYTTDRVTERYLALYGAILRKSRIQEKPKSFLEF